MQVKKKPGRPATGRTERIKICLDVDPKTYPILIAKRAVQKLSFGRLVDLAFQGE